MNLEEITIRLSILKQNTIIFMQWETERIEQCNEKAFDYVLLGELYRKIGDIKKTQEMYRKADELYEKGRRMR